MSPVRNSPAARRLSRGALALAMLALGGVAQPPGDTAPRVPARIRAEVEVSVPAEVAGVVLERPVPRGATVEAGAVILRVDPTFPRIAVRKAEAALDKARAEFEWARNDLEREQRLAKSDTAAGANVERRRAEFAAAEAQCRAAEAVLDEAKESLARCSVRAPIAGVVHELPFERGEMVPTGATVAVILGVQNLVAESFLAPGELRGLAVDMEVGVEILDAGDLPLRVRGRIRELAAAAGKNRTFRVVVALEEPPSAVRAGFEAKLVLPRLP